MWLQNLNVFLTQISHKAHAYQPGMTRGCDLCLTEKVKILLGHNGPEKITKSVIRHGQVVQCVSEHGIDDDKH